MTYSNPHISHRQSVKDQARAYTYLLLRRQKHHGLQIFFTVIVPFFLYLLLLLAIILINHFKDTQAKPPVNYFELPIQVPVIDHYRMIVNDETSSVNLSVFANQFISTESISRDEIDKYIMDNANDSTYGIFGIKEYNEDKLNYEYYFRNSYVNSNISYAFGNVSDEDINEDGSMEFYDQFAGQAIGHFLNTLSGATLNYTMFYVPFLLPEDLGAIADQMRPVMGAMIILIGLHIALPLTTMSLVSEKHCGFSYLLNISGMSHKIIFIANLTFYYLVGVVAILMNIIFAAIFSVQEMTSIGAPLFYFVIIWPAYIVTLSHVLSAIIKSPVTSSLVSWAIIIAGCSLMAMICYVFDYDKNPFSFVPTATIFYAIRYAEDPVWTTYVTPFLCVAYAMILLPICYMIESKKMNKVYRRPIDGNAVEVLNDERNAMSVLELTKKYKNFVAVNNITFDVEKGSITALCGQNGSGKTTTVNMISGKTRRTSGGIYVYGNMGHVPQYDTMPDDAEVGFLLDCFAGIRSCENVEDAKNELIELLDLGDHVGKTIDKLSGGTKRRVMLSCAVIGLRHGDILICDEATTGLSMKNIEKTNVLFRDMKSKGISALIISHDLEEVATIADHIIVMKNGDIIVDKSKKELLLDVERSGYHVKSSHSLYSPFLIEEHITTISSTKEYSLSQMNDLVQPIIDHEDVFVRSNTLKDLFIHMQ